MNHVLTGIIMNDRQIGMIIKKWLIISDETDYYQPHDKS